MARGSPRLDPTKTPLREQQKLAGVDRTIKRWCNKEDAMNANVTPGAAPKRETIGASGATKFSMRGLPLLSDGASFDALATADNLWLSVKVYSSGGENALHKHTVEDHAFVVLQGRGTFHFDDGSKSE